VVTNIVDMRRVRMKQSHELLVYSHLTFFEIPTFCSFYFFFKKLESKKKLENFMPENRKAI
jgi:hypothetical protein